MDGRRFGYALATVLLAAGGATYGVGALVLAEANAEERACRATNDGLDELQCMNFAGIGFAFTTAWGLGLMAAGALAAAITWLVTRDRAVGRTGS